MEHSSSERFTDSEVLETLRELIQDEIDPRTGEGRGFDAELGKAELLREKLGIDTPDKALALLQEAIKRQYDPFDNINPSKNTDAGWPTHLSGLIEGRGASVVYEGDDDYDVDLWIERIRTVAHDGQPPDVIPFLKRRQFMDNPQEFWVDRINELTIQSVKLASKRSLRIDQEYRPQDDDSYHGSGEKPQSLEAEGAQSVKRSRLLGSLAFISRKTH